MNDTAQGTFRFHGTTSPFTDHALISDLLGLPAEKVHETLASYSLRDLGTMTEHELREAGLTPARARKLRTAFELAKRFQNGKPVLRGQPFSTPRQIFDTYHVRFRDEKREHFLIITLDARHRVMNEHLISIGSLTSSIVHPREVFRPAVREAAGRSSE